MNSLYEVIGKLYVQLLQVTTANDQLESANKDANKQIEQLTNLLNKNNTGNG